jgi:hypothetical protein
VSRVSGADAAQILEVLARYAQVIDNRDWAHADLVFAWAGRRSSAPASASCGR